MPYIHELARQKAAKEAEERASYWRLVKSYEQHAHESIEVAHLFEKTKNDFEKHGEYDPSESHPLITQGRIR